MQYKSLEYVVRNVIIEAYEPNDDNYMTYLQLAALCARESNFGSPLNIKTVLIKYDRQKRYIDLPSDCVDYTKIGILAGDKVLLLGLNKSIAKPRHYNACGLITPYPLQNESTKDLDPFSPDFNIFFYNYYYNGIWGAVYGYGPLDNNNGEYDYDPELNRLIFGAGIHSECIYLEYKSNGIQEDGSILIPEQLVDELVQCVHWRRLRFRKGETNFDKERARKDYIVAKKAGRRKMGSSLSEYYDYSFTNYTQAPK